MDRNNPYYQQVMLLIRVLPFVYQENCFALKGGTAINLFVRDFPRLSVDIDLVYLPQADRQQALTEIHAALDRIAVLIEQAIAGATVAKAYQRKPDALRMVVNHRAASIKIELSPVLRGTIHLPQTLAVVEQVERIFGFTEARVLAFAELYAGKICAALDRQHPRDLFDVLLFLENEKFSDELRKAFLVYLISHSRPMEELLAPNWRPLQSIYENEFNGMAFRNVTVEELQSAGKQMLCTLLVTMTEEEKRFLCSLYQGSVDWSALNLEGASDLPAVQWKLGNIAKMSDEKRVAALAKLRRVLGIKSPPT